jgi:hypothetical protein
MATPAIGPPPGRDEALPSTATTATMVGEDPATQGADREQQSRAFVSQVKTMHTQLDDISRQYPAFASFARKAQEALKDGMVKTLSEMQSQPAASSSLPGMA